MNIEEILEEVDKDLQGDLVTDFREIEQKKKKKCSFTRLQHIYHDHFYVQEQFLDEGLKEIIQNSVEKMRKSSAKIFNAKRRKRNFDKKNA